MRSCWVVARYFLAVLRALRRVCGPNSLSLLVGYRSLGKCRKVAHWYKCKSLEVRLVFACLSGG